MIQRRSGLPLVLAIRLYRSTLAKLPRSSVCLFDQTCSRYVEHIAGTGGLRAGLRAANRRLRSCRPGYTFEFEGDQWTICCVDGSVHEPSELAPALHDEARMLAACL